MGLQMCIYRHGQEKDESLLRDFHYAIVRSKPSAYTKVEDKNDCKVQISIITSA